MLIKSMSYSTHSLSHQHPNTFQYFNDPRSKRRLRRDLRQALKNIRYIAAHVAYESFIESLCDEWKFIAIVFDRLQFIIFSLVTLIATFTLFFQVRQIARRRLNQCESSFLRFLISSTSIVNIRKNWFDFQIQIRQ